MSDPLSISASATAILQLTSTIVQYLNDMKGFTEERNRIIEEVSSISGFLYILKDLAERPQGDKTWSATVTSLNVPNGPLEQFRIVLEQLASKLEPVRGLKKIGKQLAWPFRKNEAQNILNTIERQKAIFNLALQNDHIRLSRAIKDNLTSLQDNVREAYEGVTELRLVQKSQESLQLMEWLSPLNLSAKQNSIFDRRQEGTGQWFLENDVFKAWVNGGGKPLCCPGPPGAGKTVLTSIVIDFLEKLFEGKNVAVIYIYFSYKEQQDQTAINLVRCLLLQLVQRAPIISEELLNVYRKYQRTRNLPTLAEWSKVLALEVRVFSRVYIVIDALDECPVTGGTRDKFLTEIRKLGSNIHLMITLRPITTIEQDFEDAARLEIHAKDEDIRKYLKCRIEKERRLARHLNADPDLQETIINTLVANAKGMFLLAQLHLNSLTKKCSKRDVRIALENMPKELYRTYDEAMRRIYSQDEDDVKLAKQVLSWISCTSRPLTIKEIQHALAVKVNQTVLDKEALPDEDLLVSVCFGLVSTDHESNIIRLVHYTAQEYFEHIQMEKFPEVHTEIAVTCLTYLSFDTFSDGQCLTAEAMNRRMQEYPLYHYAAQYWGDHARRGPEETVKEFAVTFLEQDSKITSAIQAIQNNKVKNSFAFNTSIVTSPLWIASYFGLTEIVKHLLGKGHDVEIRTTNSDIAIERLGQTALYIAALNGHETTSKVLLQAGAKVNARGGQHCHALQAASIKGHESIVKLLLETGADVNAQESKLGKYFSAQEDDSLQAALSLGHERVAMLLLKNGANVNNQGGLNGNALQVASIYGSVQIVQMLLDNGADINAQGGKYGNALQAAASEGNEQLVRLLLESGAKANIQGGTYGSALIAASSFKGNEQVVQLLLEKGANINSQGGEWGNALNAASSSGDERILRVLLENGADINAHRRFQGSALQLALRSCHEQIALLLLEKGADINAPQGHFGTALQLALKSGFERIVRLCLSKGADINAQGGFWGNALEVALFSGNLQQVQLILESGFNVNMTQPSHGDVQPLQLALILGNEEAARLLLAYGVDANAQGGPCDNALQVASRLGQFQMVQLLLEKGVDINAQGADHGSALQAASCGGHSYIAKLLLEAGADVNAQGGQHGSALRAASLRGDEKTVQLLLDWGADFDWPGGFGGSALYVASDRGHYQIIQTLLEKGANINAQGGPAGNPLQAASMKGHEEVVKLLLEWAPNVNAYSGAQSYALIAASSEGHEQIVQLLLQNGADVNAQGIDHDNALQAACARGHANIVRILLQNGADIKAHGGHYGSALQAASCEGHEKVIQILLDKGANINASCKYHGNALQAAFHQGNKRVMQLLLENGANSNVKDIGAMYQEILNRKESTLGEDHISTLDTIKHLARLYRSQGRLAEAETMYERVLDSEIKMVSDDNLSTLHTVNILGILYAKKRASDSKAMFLRAVKGYAEILGPNEILLARAFHNLGTFFTCKCKTAGQPIEEHQPSAAIKEPVLEPESMPKSLQIPSSVVENLERLTNAEAASINPRWEYLPESNLLLFPMVIRRTDKGVDMYRCSPNASKGTNISAIIENYHVCCMDIYPRLLNFSFKIY